MTSLSSKNIDERRNIVVTRQFQKAYRSAEHVALNDETITKTRRRKFVENGNELLR